MKHSLVTKKSLKKFMKLLNVILKLERKVFQVTCLVRLWKNVKTQVEFYLMNVDHANDRLHLFRKGSRKQSNLCCEINLSTKSLQDFFNDPEGEIALCTLSATYWGNIKDPKDFEKSCDLAVRGLDALLTYQNYPVTAARNSTEKRRSLGIGIINLAYWMAKNDMTHIQILT